MLLFAAVSALAEGAQGLGGQVCQKQQVGPNFALFTAGPAFRLLKVLSWTSFQLAQW